VTRSKAPPEWLTSAQVAERFNTSVKAIARWVNAGTIPAEHVRRTPGRKPGFGHIRIRAAWVDAWLNGSGDGS
jgi:excisionase family DNA binding protein